MPTMTFRVPAGLSQSLAEDLLRSSLAGGHGSVLGTLAGALLMSFLRNRCTALGWPNFVQEMIVGHIIVVAVALDAWRARHRGR